MSYSKLYYICDKFTKLMKNERQSNIELLRIVLMLMIVFLHLIVHSCDIILLSTNSYPINDKSIYYLSSLAFVMIAVNCFIFISGYYGIKFRLQTIISLFIQAIFYSLTIYLTLKYIANKPEYLINENMFKSISPISHNQWWFLNAYLALFILSPIINKGLDFINKYQFGLIVLILIYLESSYVITGVNTLTNGIGLYPLLIIYLVAVFCRKYILTIKNPGQLIVYSTFIIFFISYISLVNKYQLLSWRVLSYVCPFIILSAILLFYIFRNLKIKNSKLINSVASLTFGVYLIHDYSGIRLFLKDIVPPILGLTDNGLVSIILLIIISIIVFIICAFIEKVRAIICKPLVEKLSSILISFFPALNE